MILRLQLSSVLVSLFLFTCFTAAWPWPPSMRDLEGIILRRQGNSNSGTDHSYNDGLAPVASTMFGRLTSLTASTSPSNTAFATPTASVTGSATNSNSATAASGSASGSAAATSGAASASGSGPTSAQTGSKTTKSAQQTSVDPRLPAGGVNMITPSALAATTYYKIGHDVSFAWNYTSLSVEPSKIDVLVTCSSNSATYTLTSNASFASTGSIVWDTKPDQTGTAPLLTASYTLIIHDAAQDVSAVAQAGHLGSYSQFVFGMYIPQSYTALADGWKCATCSGALSDMERQAMKFMFGMCAVTIISFTWFVGGLGAVF